MHQSYPRTPGDPSDADPATGTPGRVTSRRIRVIINARSGAADHVEAVTAVEATLSAGGGQVTTQLVHRPEELDAAAAQAADSDADVVVAGGGDGTIGSVAARLVGTGKALGVLPLGTFNYFARRFGIPLELDGALQVVATGRPVRVGVGDVNGRVFLNNSSIGLYPSVLRKRESTYGRVGRSQIAAYLSAGLVLVQPPGVLNLQITADGVPLTRRTPLLFVGANPEQLATFGLSAASCADAGQLAVCITRPLGGLQLWRLALRGALRGLNGAEELEVVCARDLVVTLRKRRVRVAMDGEIVRLTSPLRYRFHPDALEVLAPAAPDVPAA